jgi:hypothetical protein
MRRVKPVLIVLVATIGLAGSVFVYARHAQATAGINPQLSFEGKIVNSNNTNITNATYNMEFKIYQDGTSTGGGTLKWTEDYLVSATQGVVLTNGTLQVNLGSITAFGSSVDWNQDTLWLSIQVGSTSSCTPAGNFQANCGGDGEMAPYIRLTSTPYAMNTKAISGITIDSLARVDALSTFTAGLASTYAASTALTVAASGSNYGLQVDESTASAVTGLKITAAAAGNGLALSEIGGNANESLTISAKGSGTITLGSGSTGDIQFFSSSYKISSSGALTVSSCTGCGGGGGTLQQVYDAGIAGDQIITLDATQDSVIIRNPASSGSDSAFAFKIEQLNTSITTAGLYIDNRGTGNSFRIDDVSGDPTPLIVDSEGRLGIGTSAIESSSSTERLLQVGSATNRGNVATYGELATKGLLRHTALANIRDVFIYDTTADSDGGRWIDWATTNKLGWYTETLDDGPGDPCTLNDDRCYNHAFPRRAILVVTTNALYIFDAATNNLWMKFSQHADGYALGVDTNNDPSSVTALNGVVYVGANGTAAGGLYAFDFVNDRMWNYNGTNRSAANAGITSRNSAISYSVDSDTKLEISPVACTGGAAIDWENVNDVYATVATNSLSAQATGAATNTTAGYGKTYVGLATNCGLTIINLAERTLLQYSDNANDDYTAIFLTRRGYIYALNTTLDQLERWDTYDTDKTSEVAGTYNRKWDETVATGPAIAATTPDMVAGRPDNLEVAERASLTSTAATDLDDVIYVGHSLGMAELHDNSTQALGWVKYYNTTRETPMMFLAGINDAVLPLDDTSGTQAQDLAIANTDVAIKGTPTLGVDGVQGKAINFDNTDDFLCSDANQDNACDVDTAFNMSTVGWTISLWFKHSTTAPATGADTIFEKCVTAAPAKATGCVIAYMTTTGTIVVANDTDATWTRPDEGAASYNITATSSLTYNDNQWHNLVLSRTNANDLDSWIDGNGMNLSTATGGTTTFDGTQIVTIGASCVLTVTANCGAATNFWDGQIDDFQFSTNTTTQGTLSATQVRRLYNYERPRASKRSITVTDATSATASSLTDTGESWFVNEFAGQIVEITGSNDSDCIGITRRVTSNTATQLNFTPDVPAACTMDTSADFQIDPEALIGSTDSVGGIGVTTKSPLGEARMMCIGTNNGSDAGGVTCYNHQAGPSLVADVYHSQSAQTDDNNVDWTGTDYDDIRSVDLSSRILVMGSEAHFTVNTEDVFLGQGLDYLSNQIYMIRNELILDGISVAGSTGVEVGYTGGADLAENYSSSEDLTPGDVVVADSVDAQSIVRSTTAYQPDVLGVISTSPGVVLGSDTLGGFPVALVGRVPVKFTTSNGAIKKGDRLTASDIKGYAMKATVAGRVIGVALEDMHPDSLTQCPEDAYFKCGQIEMFVNVTDFGGVPLTELVSMMDDGTFDTAGDDLGLSVAVDTPLSIAPEDNVNLIGLERLKALYGQSSILDSSEILVGRLRAIDSIITPTLVVRNLVADSIKANQIEGLELLVDKISARSSQSTTPKNAQASMGTLDIVNLLNGVKFDGLQTTDLLVLAQLEAQGGLLVDKDAQFNGKTIFALLAQFNGPTEFNDQATFNNDAGGQAVIKKDAKKVTVTFTKAYIQAPIVVASWSFADTKDSTNKIIDSSEAKQQRLIDGDYSFSVANVTTKSFDIILNDFTSEDLTLNWIAMAIKDAKMIQSDNSTNSNILNSQ